MHAKSSITNYAQQLNKQGYFVIEQVLPEAVCKELLGYMISSFPSAQPDFIIEPNFRIHVPLSLTPLVNAAVRTVLSPATAVVRDFLQGSQVLAELSSITVFPYAKAQNIHPDEQNSHRQLISVFVNLAPTTRESGALRIVPGSHLNAEKNYSQSTTRVLELPTGSAVFMNSKTWHGGGANSTSNEIRPVFYFSFGEPDLSGPTYSILPEVRQQGKKLSDFMTSVKPPVEIWHENARPKIPKNTLVTSILGYEDTSEITLLLIKNCRVIRQLKVTPKTPWLLEAIKLVTQRSGELTLSEIGSQLEVDIPWLIEFFSYYGSEGWFCVEQTQAER